MTTLINNVRQWFHDKGIIENSNSLKQLEKTQEELTETRDAAVRLGCTRFYANQLAPDLYEDQRELYLHELKDGIGDTVVTLIGVCEMLKIDFLELLLDESSKKFVDSLGEDTKDVLDAAQGVLTDLVIYRVLGLDMRRGVGQLSWCMVALCDQYGFTLEECLQQAYDVISKRSGKMVDGKFVKEYNAEEHQSQYP